jgi:DNA recombination protein RmuC
MDIPLDIGLTAALAGVALTLCAVLGGLAFRGAGRERELRGALELTRAELSAAEAARRALEESRAETRDERDSLAARLSEAQAELADRRVEIENLSSNLAAERRAHAEKLAELKDIQTRFETQIENRLKVTVNDLLEGSSKTFVERAEAVLKGQREQGETGMKNLVTPLREQLDKFQGQVTEMEAKRKKDEGELIAQIRHVSESHAKLNDTTSTLVNALRSAPKTRGRWGELQLENVLELAGMSEHVDFETEKHFATEDGAQRPDAILHMPGGRTLVVDAKTSLSAYLEAMEADTEEAREAKLVEHARQIRTHVDALGRKDYWKSLPTDTVDFVVMFVPGEPMYAAAMARDPGLFEDAWAKKVIVCSPTTLLGLAKAIAYGWRQEKASRDARKIHEVASELYKRLAKMGGDVAGMTRSLNAHVGKHNAFVASLEARVLPQARKMSELSIGDAELPELEPVEQDVRAPVEGKDLEIDEVKRIEAAE